MAALSSGSPRTPARRGLRLVLAALAAGAAFPGAWATLAPRSFYGRFPGLGAWVAPLGPYDGHLVGDVGAFYLAFAVLFAWAAWRPTRDLVLPVCGAWTLFSLLHLAWHAAHTAPFSAADTIGMLGLLAVVVALPGTAALLVTRRRPAPAARPPA